MQLVGELLLMRMPKKFSKGGGNDRKIVVFDRQSIGTTK